MANKIQPSPFLGVVRAQLVDKDGIATFALLKLFQDWNDRLEKGLNIIGEFIGNISPVAHIGARPEGIGTTVQHITATGQLASLTNIAADVDTDHIADGAGTPLGGGRTAALALASGAVGQALVYHTLLGWRAGPVAYSQVTGGPVAPGPGTAGPVAHQWISAYDTTTGAYALSQPGFSDISGQITGAQLPATGLTVTIVTAQLTPTGAQGSMTFINGILTGLTPAT